VIDRSPGVDDQYSRTDPLGSLDRSEPTADRRRPDHAHHAHDPNDHHRHVGREQPGGDVRVVHDAEVAILTGR